MTALIAHLACTWSLVGLIWVIQVLAYPQFLRVGESDFPGYHMAHCWRIGILVAPLILAEASTAAWILYQGERSACFIISLVPLIIVWLSTALLQAPAHTRLMQGFDAPTIHRLIRSNWLRTFAWTMRALLVSAITLR
jgi:hypothetical protein